MIGPGSGGATPTETPTKTLGGGSNGGALPDSGVGGVGGGSSSGGSGTAGEGMGGVEPGGASNGGDGTAGTGSGGSTGGAAGGGSGGSSASCPMTGEVSACADTVANPDLGSGCPRFFSSCTQWTVVSGTTPLAITLDADYARLAYAGVSLGYGGTPTWTLLTHTDSPLAFHITPWSSVSSAGGTMQSISLTLQDRADACPQSSTRIDIVVLSASDCP